MALANRLKTILQAKALSHPLHPVLVHIPIGAWSLSFVFDLIGTCTSDPALQASMGRSASMALIMGLICAVPAVITGLAEFADLPTKSVSRSLGWAHMGVNIILTLSYLMQAILRSTRDTVSLFLVITNGASFVLLGASGYLGGKLVYQHRVGIRSAENPQRITNPIDHRVL